MPEISLPTKAQVAEVLSGTTRIEADTQDIQNKVNLLSGAPKVVKSVQRGSTSSYETNKVIPISTVVPEKCLVILSGSGEMGNPPYPVTTTLGYTLTVDSLTIKNLVNNNQDFIAYWQVIEFY